MASTPRCVSSFMRIVRASCPVCSRSARGYRDPGVGNYTSTGNGFNFSHSSSNSSSSSADHSSSSSFSGFFSGDNSNSGAAFFGNSGNKFPFNFQAGGQAPSFDFHSLFAGGQVPTPGAHASSAGNEGAPFSTQLSPADSQGSFSQEQGSQGSQSAAGTSAGIRPHGSGSPVNTQDSPSIIVTTPNRSTVTPPSVGVQFTTDNPGSSTAASTVYFQSTTFAPEGSTHKSFSHIHTDVNSAPSQTPQELNTQPGPKISTAGTHGLLSGKDTLASNTQDLQSHKDFGFASFHFQTSTHNPIAVSFQPDTQEAVTAVTPIDLDYLDHSVGTQDSSIQLETGSQTYQNGEHSLTDLQQSQSRADGDISSTGPQQHSFDFQSENEDSGATTTDFLNFQQKIKTQSPEFLLNTDASDAGNQETSFGIRDTTQASSTFGTSNSASKTQGSVGFPSNTNDFASATERSAASTGSSSSNTGSSNAYQAATNSFFSSTQAPILGDIPASSSASQFDYDYHTDDSTTFLSTSPVVTKPAFPPISSSTGNLPAPESHLPPSEFQVGTSDSSVQAVVPSSGVQSDVSFSLSGSETSAPDFHFDTGFSSNQDYDTQESSYSEQPNTQSGIPDASVNIHGSKSSSLDTRELASVSDSSPSVQRAIVDQQSNIHNSPAKTQGFSGLHSAELGPSITNQEQSFQTELPGANVDYDTQEAAHGIHQGIFASASDAQENSGNFHRADAFLPNSRDSPSDHQGDSHGSATGVQDITHDLQHGTEESQSGHNYGIHGSYSSTTEPSFGVPLDTSASATSGTPTKQASVITANAGTGRFHEETEGDPATANHGLITNIQDPSTGLHSTAFINFGSTVDGDYDLLADSQDLPTGVQGAATAFDFSSTDSQKFDANDHDSHRLSSTDIHAPGTRLTESNNPLLSTDSYTDAQDLFSSPDDHDSAASDQTSDDQFLSATDQFSTDENYLSSDSDNSATDNQFSTEGGQFSFTTNQFPVDYDSPADSQFSSPDYDDSVADSQYSSTGHQLSSTTNQFSSSDNHELDNLFSSDSAADNQFSSSLNQFVPIDNDNRRDSSFDDYDSSKNNQFSSTFSQFSPSDNLDSTATQFTSTDSQFSGSTDSETENQSSAFDKYDSITDNRFESDPNVQFPSDDPDAATDNPSSSSDSYDSPVGAHFSASGSQGSLFAFTSSGLASGSTTGYMSHGIKRPSSLGQRSGSGVVGGSGLAGFIVQLTGKGAVHPGVCPTLRKDCAASRSAPKTCLNDSTCRPSEKCCFDTCSAALWVCTPSVLPA
ncbi:hypothetical protein C7M84_011526 [Penaeus vannamei]|uniref:WAP domain-containing protein n=1 Tax=Penaeus vannamei TaxID=6689 RepID=A0A423T179_PENVA|nr:hypothetical protein C7M84_011526 [Penaeus vannamei]